MESFSPIINNHKVYYKGRVNTLSAWPFDNCESSIQIKKNQFIPHHLCKLGDSYLSHYHAPSSATGYLHVYKPGAAFDKTLRIRERYTY